MHQAAKQMLEALKTAVTVWEKRNAALTINKRDLFPPIWVTEAMAAIAAAGG
jgi:hypothetical protein